MKTSWSVDYLNSKMSGREQGDSMSNFEVREIRAQAYKLRTFCRNTLAVQNRKKGDSEKCQQQMI